MKVVIDSNKIFSALISENGSISQLLSSENFSFIAPNFTFLEIFKYKEKIIKYSNKTEPEVLRLLNLILLEISFFNENSISKKSIQTAFDLCKDIDPLDTPFVALSIDLDAPLWTGDKKLIKGLKAKGFDNFFEEDSIAS
jgi:predicted nucleic acid-binding protein